MRALSQALWARPAAFRVWSNADRLRRAPPRSPGGRAGRGGQLRLHKSGSASSRTLATTRIAVKSRLTPIASGSSGPGHPCRTAGSSAAAATPGALPVFSRMVGFIAVAGSAADAHGRSGPRPHRVTFGPQRAAVPDRADPERRSELRRSIRGSERLGRRRSVPLLRFRPALGNFPQRCGVRRPAHPITTKRRNRLTSQRREQGCFQPSLGGPLKG